MSRFYRAVDHLFHRLLSEEMKEKGEKVIVYIAIGSFLLHLSIIFLVDFGLLDLPDPSKLLTNPIAAIYTPFSFILIYEVYLLVYYLPQSITTYIGKQYEIITLIVIRRVFKDLSNLELSSNWFKIQNDLQFTYDIIAALLLFLCIYFFNRLSPRQWKEDPEEKKLPTSTQRFIRIKKTIAVFLVPLLLVLAVYRFAEWAYKHIFSIGEMVKTIKDVNNIFFDEFFTVLILVDVVLLLFSMIHTDKFSKLIRNAGFIISTILIRMSFSVEGLINTSLILVGVVFGLLILYIHNLFEKQDFQS